MSKIWRFTICWCLLVSCAFAQPQSGPAPAPLLTPTYLKQRQFFLPYQMPNSGTLIERIAKVQLLLSRTGPSDWATLEEAEPNVRGFTYHAPEDGEYLFAIRHLDRRGRPWPNDTVQPQRRIVIDTQLPELTLEGSQDTNGEMVVRYEARDANLQAETFVLEIRAAGESWIPLQPTEHDVAQPNRLVGRVRWQPPAETRDVEVRAAIADRAGHRGQAHEQLTARTMLPDFEGPTLNGPSSQLTQKLQPIGTRSENKTSRELTNPFAPSSISNPFVNNQRETPSSLPSQDWPTTNQVPTQQPSVTSQPTPPQSNPYSLANSSRPPVNASGSQTLEITPLGPDMAPPLMGTHSASAPSATPNPQHGVWSSASADTAHATRIVNARTFDIEYDLQSIGPWGVSKVELWGSPDDGQSWRSFAIDPDNRSPVRVTVPGAGKFGFRILVDGANSAGAIPPQPGDEPELYVAVDLQPPTAKLIGTQIGTGNQADHLHVNWSASDTNLEARPIALFYSSYPNGPWSTIASGLQNTGSYTWRIERHVPARFYLRLEARDTAGNVANYQTAAPVELARPQPTGRLRNVRPITGG